MAKARKGAHLLRGRKRQSQAAERQDGTGRGRSGAQAAGSGKEKREAGEGGVVAVQWKTVPGPDAAFPDCGAPL